MNQIIAMTQDPYGDWEYTDTAENDMVFELEQISGINLSGYDALLNDEPKWVGHEEKRQILADLRLELAHHFRLHFADTDRLDLLVESYHQAFDMVRMQITGLVLATAQNRHRKSQSKRRLGKGLALTPQMEKRVIERYQERVKNGEKYGAVRGLAEIFRVSETTIKKLLKNAK